MFLLLTANATLFFFYFILLVSMFILLIGGYVFLLEKGILGPKKYDWATKDLIWEPEAQQPPHEQPSMDFITDMELHLSSLRPRHLRR